MEQLLEEMTRFYGVRYNEGNVKAFEIFKFLYADANDKVIEKQFTDSGLDRGLDFYSIIVNKELIDIDKALKKILLNSNNELILNLYQVKSAYSLSSSFMENELIKLITLFESTVSFIEGNLPIKDINVNAVVIKLIEFLGMVYKNIRKIKNIEVNICMVSNCTDIEYKTNIGMELEHKAQIITILKRIYGEKANVKFKFMPEYTLKPFSSTGRENVVKLQAPYCEKIGESNDSMIAIINGDVLLNMLSKVNGEISEQIKNIDRLLFDDNVRSFLGSNKINQKISEKYLECIKDNIKFWIYNNGITITSTKFFHHPNKEIEIFNPQIINGQQTIMTFLDFIKEKVAENEITRSDLIKIEFILKIISNEANNDVEGIIISSNTQSKITYLDLSSVNNKLESLEYRLNKDNIDYQRKRNQIPRGNSNIHVNNSSMLQLICTVYGLGPSFAKNKLELFVTSDEFDKKIIEAHKNYNSFKKIIEFSDFLNKDKIVKRKFSNNPIYKYAKLHILYIFSKNEYNTDIEFLEKCIKKVEKGFKEYSTKNKKEFNYEKISKVIPNRHLKK